MALIRVRPQHVRHTDGWEVASYDRERMIYEQGDRVALVYIDDGFPAYRVYVNSLVWVAPDGSEVAPTKAEQAVIWPRFIEGMEALGMQLELFDG